MSSDKIPQTPETSLSQVEQELKKINPQLFHGLKNDKKREVIQTILSISTKIHSGPLPDPETLQAYNNVVPNSATMIFDVFLRQSDHRMRIEENVIGSQQRQSSRGQHYAFAIAILFFIGSVLLVYLGHDVAGGVLGSVDVLGLVTVFITGRYYQRGNLERKNPDSKLSKK